jgi:hypothetical protein
MRILLLVPLLLAGCAATPATDKQTADANAEVCVREYRVGSNIPVVTCSVPQTTAERERAIDEMRNSVRPSTRVPGAGGG